MRKRSETRVGRPDTRQWSAFLTAALLVGFLTGCYTYRPLTGPPADGASIRAVLTAEAAVRESELRGELIQFMDGTVVGTGGDSVSISVVANRAIGSTHVRDLRQVVKLGRDDVTLFSERQMSWAKTALVVVGAAGGVALLLGTLEAGGNAGGDGGGGDTALRGGFRIPIPIGR